MESYQDEENSSIIQDDNEKNLNDNENNSDSSEKENNLENNQSANNKYSQLKRRIKAIEDDISHDIPKSLNDLFKIALEYNSYEENDEVKYENNSCFVDSMELINKIIIKHDPMNCDQIISLFLDFYQEENRIIKNSDSKNSYNDYFTHYENFANKLQPELIKVLNTFPKYNTEPISIKLLLVLTIIVIILYIFVMNMDI